MAKSTDSQPLLQRRFVEVFFEASTPVHLFGDEVMEGQRHLTLATAAGATVARHAQL
jgi:hypothetical protein